MPKNNRTFRWISVLSLAVIVSFLVHGKDADMNTFFPDVKGWEKADSPTLYDSNTLIRIHQWRSGSISQF